MNTSKIIKGVVSNGRYTVTAPIVKENYGIYLQIEGVELPETYQMDFSNDEHHGTSVTMIGNADGVRIPRQFIDTGKDIFAFLYWVGEDYGKTVYKFRIPNKLRPDRTNEEPTPEEQSVIDQVIASLNDAVAQTAQDKANADASAQASAESAQASGESALSASNSALSSGEYASNALGYAESASASATASAQSASQSAQIKADVEDLADDAQASANASAQSANNAQTHANTAEQAKVDSQTAQGLAESARDSAISAKTDAESAKADAESARDEAVNAVASISGALADKAPIITDTASGAIASFSDGADNLPLKSLVVNIDPVQDLSNGDPSPENICPISGRTQVDVEQRGVNVWDEEWEVGTLNNTTGLPYPDPDNIRSKNFCSCKPNTGYYFYSGSNKTLRYYWYDADYNHIGNDTVTNAVRTSPSNARYFKVRTTQSYGNTYNHDISINYPSTDHDYHPYTGRSITIDLGQTVYGGKLDVLSGELVVDRAINVIDGTQALALNGIQSYGGAQVRYIPNPTKALADSGATQNGGLLSDKFSTSSPYPSTEYQLTGRATNANVYINMPATVTTVEQARTWFASNPTQVVYKLANPITIQLTSNQVNSLYGVNNIWADSGDTEAVYRADTKLYIAKKIAEAISALS